MTEEGYKYILTCQDNLSKYVLAVPMMTQTAEEVALNFMRHILLQYGIPLSIVTDQGTKFMGDVFKRLCKLLKVRKLNTSSFRPQSNGSLERTHKTMVEYLRCFCDPRVSGWSNWIPFSCFVYNTTPHTMTKYTPYEVLFGRKANVPGKLQQQPTPMYNYDDLVHDIKMKLQECHKIARANLVRTKQHRVEQQASETNVPKFHVGNAVLLRNEKAGKLDPLWLGPFTIVEIHPNGSNVTIRLSKSKRVQVHINRLKKYQSKE
jgi:hypothetical protein